MAPKSIWRGPNAQHFTLVHRSQQDPLLNDAEASNRVLKATPKRHEASGGQSRRELEHALGAIANQERKNVGEAANYGILFDDTEYDYMQHLRPIGGNDNSRRGGKDEAEEEEVIMLEAPRAQRKKDKAPESGGDLTFKEFGLSLPQEVLPSQEMIPRTFEQDKQTGIRPDMDPHLRQVLEALDDDAFLMRTAGHKTADREEQVAVVEEGDGNAGKDVGADDDEDIDDFFDEIVVGGQLGADEQEPEWRHLPPGGEETIWLDPSARAARELLQLKQEGKGVDDLSLESRVALFKKAAAERQAHDKAAGGRSVVAPSSVGSKSIFGEKGASRRSRHAGAKARLAASYYAPSIDGGATAFSMSSSAMERNQGLSTLDERFARMERIYEQDGHDDEDGEGVEDALNALAEAEDENAVGGPENVDAIFDEFLSRNEVIGKRMRERLGGREMTSVEKVDMIRAELGQMRLIDRQTVDEAQAAGQGPSTTVEELISRDLAARRNVRNAWDVETIQSTRTNLENHPRTIAAATSVAPSRISRIVPGAVDGDQASVAGGTDRMARVKIDARTGLPKVSGYIHIGARQARRQGQQQDEGAEKSSLSDSSPNDEDDEDDEYASDDTTTEDNLLRSTTTVKRDRNESKEEKKARKQAVKEEKQARKAQKSMRKQQFKSALSSSNGPSATAPLAARVALQ